METANKAIGWKPLKRFFALLKPDQKDISYIYLYAIFAGLITLTLPLGIQAIIGLIAGGTMSSSLLILIAIVTLGTSLAGVLKVMQLTVTESIQRRIFTRSAFEFAFRLPHIRLESMRREYPPELVNRFFDTLTLQKGVPKILMDFSSAVLQIVFGLILLSFYHPFFVFFGMVLLFILILIFRITGPGGLRTSLQESKYKYAVAHWLEELARVMMTFKLSGDSKLNLRNTNQLTEGYLKARKGHFRILLWQYGYIVAFKTVITAALLLLGSILVMNNQLNIGQFVAAEIVVILILASAEKLILTMETVYDVLTALEKIGTVTDMPLDRHNGVFFEEIDTGKGMSVTLRDLYFRFEDDENPTLDGISMDIAPGERVCIAGYNRAGKSTFVNIVAGLYNSYEGSVSYNNIPMRNFCLPNLRRQIGDYNSEEDIFRGTILDNIRLGRSEVELEDVIRACQQVGLEEFIQKQPYGFETELLPDGRNVPGSIRTKIILARSIARHPRLLVMEDVFNSLEKKDRTDIARLLTDKERGWTLIAVSDDPELAALCDRILVMRRGKIIDSGTFQEIQKSPHYENIFKTNSKIAS
ncbi:MAG: ABC transporter ATP-binding protein [Bacteroidota bacterium]